MPKVGSKNDRYTLITVHGIRIFGNWPARLEALIVQARGERKTNVRQYRFGFFTVIAFLIPFLRNYAVHLFARNLFILSKQENSDRIDIVAHDYGCYIVGHALKKINISKDIPIHTVIFAGNTVSPNFPVHKLIKNGVQRIVNDCATRDWELLITQLLVFGTGAAGRFGISGVQTDRFINRYFSIGHRGYFFNLQGKTSDEFMKDYWLPILTGDGKVQLIDERAPLTPISAFFQSLIINAQIYVLAVIFLAVFIPQMYLFYTITDPSGEFFSIFVERAVLVIALVLVVPTLIWGYSVRHEPITPDSLSKWRELLSEPIHETTRKIRRSLLGVSAICLIFSHTGLTPKKIPALDLEITAEAEKNIPTVLAFILAYFLVTFCVYMRTELTGILLHRDVPEAIRASLFTRVFFEAGLPILVSVAAIIYLIII